MVRIAQTRRLLAFPYTRTALAALGVAAMGALIAQAQAPAPPAAPKSPAKVAPGKPPELAAAAAPAAAPAEQGSLLGGAWKVNWVRLGKVTAMTIGNEQGQPGIVGFDSALTDLGGGECKGGGFAARSLGGVYSSGGDVNMVGVADYMRVVAKCAGGQLSLEAFGLAGQPPQWVGRAMLIDDKGQRHSESFIATR